MTDIEDALKRSSLGTPGARAAIEATPAEVGRYYVDLARVYDAGAEIGLGGFYRGIVGWLDAPHLALDGETPRALIKRGETDRVLALIDAIAEGAYL